MSFAAVYTFSYRNGLAAVIDEVSLELYVVPYILQEMTLFH